MPGYSTWIKEFNDRMSGLMKGEIDKIDARIATQAELNLTNSTLMSLEAKFTTYQKKSTAEITELKGKFDMETLKTIFCTKNEPDKMLKRIAELE